tara:strand:- start:1896 stop:2969 length:1074 start_codon:yes stop_codon:yes gene_type:complete
MIKITNVNHFFNEKQILKDFSLTINSNSVTSILGPSGSGKTTLLRLISGLENLQSGNIQIDNNKNIYSSKNNDAMSNVSFVFQDSALFPHLTVIENIYYGLSKLNNNKNKIDNLINDYDIDKIKYSYPHQLSGGQKQLVALLRGLASNPKIILLDEPFANLDTRLREKLRDKVLHILKDNNITSIIVTHDADEAMFLSDYIAILENGQIQQHGKPVELYTRPKNRFVAEFFGEINVINGRKVNNELHTPLGNFDLNKNNLKENYSLVVRSEGIKIIKSIEDDSIISNKRNNNLVKSPNNGRIIEAKFLGGSTIVHLALNGMKDYEHLHIKIPGINYFENNQIVNLYTDVNYSYIFET